MRSENIYYTYLGNISDQINEISDQKSYTSIHKFCK